jgi:hypothetical protein
LTNLCPIRLHADISNPALYQQLRKYAMPEGDSMFIATLADPPRKMRELTVGPEAEMPADDAAAEEGGGMMDPLTGPDGFLMRPARCIFET